ncbi:hypothetical protein G7Y89_g5674 [Cudoniella acicularis]|uniref:Uncharacterized protein n=1 Tax=Cudoniella acicularis TaxID=354080 RepID=A0A8H4W368_9HELO|nr:hypothetical protein G7Y89_g5674 [Cudoniella acicularis]
MSAPLTFGVELEFAIATEDWRGNRELLAPGLNRTTQKPMVSSHVRQRAAKRIFGSALRESGYPVQSDVDIAKDNSQWTLDIDHSVRGPMDSPYKWYAIEVTYPAYSFSAEALRAVENVCSILIKSFIIETNETTGLHVHVRNGNSGFTFDSLRKLMAFLWAFTPQLESLHPFGRTGGSTEEEINFSCSMREASGFATCRGQLKNGRPSPIEGVAAILNSSTKKELYKMVTGSDWNARYMAYNVWDLAMWEMPDESDDTVAYKPTIEFRQHEGTVDPARVINWIRTVVDLFSQRDFTIIHLLNYLDLSGPAKFYADNGYPLKHAKKVGPDSPKPRWDYERSKIIPYTESQKQQQRALHDTFEALQRASRAQGELEAQRQVFKFDPTEAIWLVHNPLLNIESATLFNEGVGEYVQTPDSSRVNSPQPYDGLEESSSSHRGSDKHPGSSEGQKNSEGEEDNFDKSDDSIGEWLIKNGLPPPSSLGSDESSDCSKGRSNDQGDSSVDSGNDSCGAIHVATAVKIVYSNVAEPTSNYDHEAQVTFNHGNIYDSESDDHGLSPLDLLVEAAQGYDSSSDDLVICQLTYSLGYHPKIPT